MSLEQLTKLAFRPVRDEGKWKSACEEAFRGLFAGGDSRYHKTGWNRKVRPRINADTSGVPYAALIHPDNPDSGPYGGTSFVLFPPNPDDEEPEDADEPMTALFGLVVGTRGLHPDEEALARPGHARKTNAICRWLNHRAPSGSQVAWAKADPVRTDRPIPKHARSAFRGHDATFDRYGDVVYGVYQPKTRSSAAKTDARDALAAFLDLLCEERGISTMSGADDGRVRNEYLDQVFETVQPDDVFRRLDRRKYLVLEGPPGTGKTRLAQTLRAEPEFYDGRGESVQFHPNVTYEDFVGGLAPAAGGGDLGLNFEPEAGALLRAADRAVRAAPDPYLFHIDEINRADLAKVLGEAVYLFEYRQFDDQERRRRIELAHDFSDDVHDSLLDDGFGLPPNLHVLGTMNTSDRSIAHLDVAIRRRFAFTKMWPQRKALRDFFNARGAVDHELPAIVLGAHDDADATNLFGQLVDIFVDFAPDDALDLMPGHSYFLAESTNELKQRLRGELLPLLEQYIREGHVAGFADELRAYMQRIEAFAGR